MSVPVLNSPMTMIELLLAGAMGYLLGAVPTGVILCRVLGATDVRQHSSGHTGGLNVSRVAGLGAGILTAVGDLLLGMAAVAIAGLLTPNPWAAVVAGALAVLGHDWSVFIGFDGGIGLSKLTGTLLCLTPMLALETVVALVLFWAILVGVLHIHRARSTILAMIVAGPLLWVLGAPPHAILLGALGGAVIITKTLPDWNRQYP